MFKLKSRSHQADSFFVMLLFFLFALTAFILVLIGVKQYKSTANAMNYNYEVRTVTSYLREKVRQNDSDAAISVETINGTKALCLKNTINDIVYNTFIYYSFKGKCFPIFCHLFSTFICSSAGLFLLAPTRYRIAGPKLTIIPIIKIGKSDVFKKAFPLSIAIIISLQYINKLTPI